MENFRKAKWTETLFSEEVKDRYLDLKKGSADRCARLLGTKVKGPEIQFHHEVYNQYLWNDF
jgi:glutamine synthetase